jgi:hypothetical protein
MVSTTITTSCARPAAYEDGAPSAAFGPDGFTSGPPTTGSATSGGGGVEYCNGGDGSAAGSGGISSMSKLHLNGSLYYDLKQWNYLCDGHGSKEGYFGHVSSLIWITNDRVLHEYFKYYYNIIPKKPTIEVSFQRSHVFGILKWQITPAPRHDVFRLLTNLV